MPDTHTFTTKIPGPDVEYGLSVKCVDVGVKLYRVTRNGHVEVIFGRSRRAVSRAVAFYGPAACAARKASGWFK